MPSGVERFQRIVSEHCPFSSRTQPCVGFSRKYAALVHCDLLSQGRCGRLAAQERPFVGLPVADDAAEKQLLCGLPAADDAAEKRRFLGTWVDCNRATAAGATEKQSHLDGFAMMWMPSSLSIVAGMQAINRGRHGRQTTTS